MGHKTDNIKRLFNDNPVILDCTLRDGSYEIDFKFTSSETTSLVHALSNSGVKLIEIGHGVGIGAREKGIGLAVCSDVEYMSAAVEGNKAGSYLGQFCIPGIAKLQDLEDVISEGLDFVRFGVTPENLSDIVPFVELAKKHDIFVFCNFMKSYVLPPKKFADLANEAIKYGCDGVYIVDSAGGMLPNELTDYYTILHELHPDIISGFHGHENLGLSVANSILAAELGAKVVDASLAGLGRSSGNTPLERLLAVMLRRSMKTNLDLLSILDLADKFISKYKPNIPNQLDTVSGLARFHSSYFPIIESVAKDYQVDPRELVIKVTEVDRLSAPVELVEKCAKELQRAQGEVRDWSNLYRQYYVNEQEIIN